MPWQLVGKKVKVIYDERNVAIYHDNIRVVQHQRSYTPNDYSTLESHLPSKHKFYAKWSTERFLAWAASIGDAARTLIQKVLDSRKHPEQAFKVCMGILNLAKPYGLGRLNKACLKAHSAGVYTFKGVKNIVEQLLEMEKQYELDFPVPPLPNHENIRGNEYYA